jgi:NitT/TauT family transport system substrate-binding protein
MTISRRDIMLSGLATGAVAALGQRPAAAADLRHVRFGVGLKLLNVTFINVMIGEPLGFTKQQGFELEGLSLGSLSAVFIALDRGDIDFGVINPSVALPLFVKGEMPPIVSFYEYSYPYKWDVAVLPASPLQSYQDLRGKKIGVSNLGATDYPVTREVLKNQGIDPDKDVSWIAVGEGTAAGLALDHGDIDALAYFDTGFGLIENSGVKLRYLPRPAAVPLIGGFFIGARRDFIEKNRDLCAGFARSIAMSSEYLLANPAAGVRAFLELYPGQAPRNVSEDEAVAQTVNTIKRRVTLYRPPYPGVKMGFIEEAEWRREADFINLPIPDLKPLFTNDLIDAANDFDHAKVIALAKAQKS